MGAPPDERHVSEPREGSTHQKNSHYCVLLVFNVTGEERGADVRRGGREDGGGGDELVQLAEDRLLRLQDFRNALLQLVNREVL